MEESNTDFMASNVEPTYDFVVKQEHKSPPRDDGTEWSSQACHIQENPTEALTIQEALALLQQHSEGMLCLIQAALPKAGESYLYDTSMIGDSWENDHYEWIAAGSEEITTDSCFLTRKTYYVRLADCLQGCMEFQRVVYSITEHPNIILVSYFGDEKLYKGKSKQLNVAELSAQMPKVLKKRGRGRPRKSELDEDLYPRAKSMDIDEAADMLDNYEDSLSRSVAQLPKGGEIYYYDTDVVGETWKYDGYMWRNSGKRNLPKHNPEYEKTFYTIRLDETSYEGCTAFQRIVFRATKRPNIVLVQYAGDENIWETAMLTNNASLDQKFGLKPVFEITEEELASPPTPVVVTDRAHEMSWQEAAQVLRSHKGKESSHRPFQPKAGEAYIFYLKAKMKEAWKYDGYDWLVQSPIYHPRERPKMSKKVHYCKTQAEHRGSKEFQKSVYCLLENLTIVLVHYHGDENAALAPVGMKRKADEELENESCRPKLEEDIVDLAPEEAGVKNRALRLQEVLDILNTYEGHVSHSRAIRPKAGEIYIFDTAIIGDDWKCDNYVWRNSGTNLQPKKNPLLRKVFFSIRLDEKVRGGSKAFQKTVYSLLARPNIVMVHYFGDESVYTALRHGNRKKGFVEYTRTVPSVMDSIKKAIVETSGSTPKNTLKHLEVAYSLDETPRNLDQIRNTKRLMAKKNVVPGSSRTFKMEPGSNIDNSLEVLQYVPTSESAQLMSGELVLVNADSGEQIVHFEAGSDPISMGSHLPGEVIYVQSKEHEHAESSDAAADQNQVEIVLQEVASGEQDTRISVNEEEIVHQPVPVKVEDMEMVQENQSVQRTPEPESLRDDNEETAAEDSSLEHSEETEEELDSDQQAVEMAQVIDLNTTSETAIRSFIANSDKSQPLLIQALDSRPEVCKVQLELLKQQQRNLALQEKKLELEIKQLEASKTATEAIGQTTPEVVHFVQGTGEGATGDSTMTATLSGDNVIYMNPEDLGEVDESQIIYLDTPIEGYSEEYTEVQEHS